ncbi:MAG: glycine--tRNA ligase subunit beta [Desulfarculaceae bacterium]|nr:glycine--tRNA ligase subunit beta [Desulfarculaceae bacterium]MCF8072402.1 glycine--tRNA ligase subunit beta [Desulfarculaceae bacterium]MCF8100323.1 glycine--tRNA ligase subunit beta [Desulfarculaceae bacterium]MCF8117910.1 glycine--tRNA ligase subunit beta [Desulfarculaceae bacterium]
MAELIFEIGCEEMPARFVAPAMEELKKLAAAKLNQARLLEGQDLAAFGTPRRLAVLVKGLKERQEDQEETALGPPVKAAYDKEGNPTKAALGFAKSQGVEVGDLSKVDTDKGERLAAIKNVPGRAAMEVLAELLPGLVEAMSFPKTMRWGDESFRFARPIHWFLALLDGAVVPFEVAGIASADRTRGHRFLAPEEIEVSGADDYLAKLEAAFVLADRPARAVKVRAEVENAASSARGRLVPDEPLMAENTDLVEWAAACCGTFDREFLEVPRPVIISAMREHQRYFALEDADGKLMPNFIAVNNTQPRDMAVVTAGHEKVLRARLADARFFLGEDRKRALIDFLEDLKEVTYHAKLGTSYEKVERFAALAGWLADTLGLPAQERDQVVRAAQLAKCDLVTEMVGEFPSLQGVVGAEYALRDGEPEAVAAGISDHYLPAGADSALPESATGMLVGIADRLDTICGLFSIGQVPTGAADPFALRRAAIAVIRVVLEKELSLSLAAMLAQALKGAEGKTERPAEEVAAEVTQFFAARFAGILADQGCPTDVAQAVLAAGLDDLNATAARAKALAAVKDSPEFVSLAAGLKRVMNILKKEADQVPSAAPDEAIMVQDEEKALYSAFQGLEAEAGQLFAAGDYAGFLARVSALKDPIDRFFDAVMVMDKDEKVRKNRLALLNLMATLFGRFARFEHLQLV